MHWCVDVNINVNVNVNANVSVSLGLSGLGPVHRCVDASMR